MPVFVIAPSQAPSGASENSPGRKPCGTSPGMLQPRKKALRAWGLTTPPDKALPPRGALWAGLLAVCICSHGLRRISVNLMLVSTPK